MIVIQRLFSILILSAITLALGACSEQENGEDSDIEVADNDTGAPVTGADPAGEPGIVRSSEPGDISDDFPFYGNPDRIERTMATVTGAQKKEPGSASSQLSYAGGRFAEIPVNAWDFGFYGGQMIFGQLQFRTEDTEESLEDLYERLSAELTDRYGEMLFDSDKQVSRQLTKFSDAEPAFIEKVGLSFPGGKFRMWTPNDSVADMLTTLNMLPKDATLQEGVVHLTWYDRLQSEAALRAVEGGGE